MAESKIKIVIDGKEAVTTVSDISQKITDFTEKLKSVDEGSEEFSRLTEIINRLSVALEKLEITIDTADAEEQINIISTSLGELQKALDVPNELVVDSISAQQEVSNLSDEIASIETPEIIVDADVSNASDSIEELKTDLGSIEDKTVEIIANSDEAVSSVNDLAASIDSIESKDLEVTVDTSSADQSVETLANDISDIESKTVEVSVDPSSANSSISEIDANLDGISSKTVDVSVNIDESNVKIEELKDSIDSIEATEVPISVDTSSADASIDQVSESIGSLEDKTITINVDGQPTIISINEVKSKLAEFTEQLASVDDGSEEFTRLSVIIDNLKSSLDDISIDVNTGVSTENIQAIEQSLSDLKDLSEEPITPEVDTQPAQKSLQELKAELKATQDEAASAGFGTPEFEVATIKAGELRDQIQDINEAINSQKGESIERLKSQFSGIADSLSKLDFAKATEQLTTFRNTASKLDFGNLAKSAGDFAKNLGGGVLDALKSVGKAVLANPLLLFGSILVGIGGALFALKDKFEIIQVAIDKITAPVKFLVGALKDLSDSIGLSNFAEQENLDKTAKAYEDKAKTIDKATKQELELARARGASAEEISQIEERAAQSAKDNAQAQLDANASILASLERKKNLGREFTESEKKQYEDLQLAIEDLAQANLGLEIIALERNKRVADDTKKSNDLAKAERDKRIAAEKAYLQQLETLQDKYATNEQDRITNRFNKELALIKGNSEKEKNLREAIIKERDNTLLKLQTDSLNKQLALSEQIALKEAELTKLNLLAIAETQQEKIDIENETSQEIFNITLSRLTREKKLAIEAAKDNAEEVKNIELQFQLDVTKIKEDSEKERLANQKESIQNQLNETLSGIDEEKKAVLEARTDIEKVVETQGILGLKSNLQALQANIDQEKALVLKAREETVNSLSTQLGVGLITQEQFEKKRADLSKSSQEELDRIEKEGLETRSQLAQQAFAQTIDLASQALFTITSLQDSQAADQQSNLDQQRSQLESDYETRKKIIEDTISDEKQKAAALSQLDKEFAGQRSNLDKQDLELKKKQIKRDRNAAIAQIALANAQSIANAVKIAGTSAFNPIQFFITLGTVLASIAVTIATARRALKDADAASSALGAGGGGSDGSSGSNTIGGGAGGQSIPPAIPSLTQPGGVNPQNQQFEGNNQGIVINPVVSVIDINAAQARVDVSETRNTIG